MEIDVAGHRFAVAVESQPYEVAPAVENGAARVPSGDVVIGDEVRVKDSLFAPSAPVFGPDQREHLVVHPKFEIFRVVFFEVSVYRRAEVVFYRVVRADRLYVAERDPHRGVGVRVLREPFRFPHPVQRFGVQGFGFVDVGFRLFFGVADSVAERHRRNRSGESYQRILHDLVGRARGFEVFAEFFEGGARAVTERVVGDRFGIAVVAGINLLQIVAPHLRRYVVRE